MGNEYSNSIFNSTNIPIKICLVDFQSNLHHKNLEPKEKCSIVTPKGRNTIHIISPVEDSTFRACLTVNHSIPVIVTRREGHLTLARGKSKTSLTFSELFSSSITDKFCDEVESRDHKDAHEREATTNNYRIIFHSYANLVYYTQIFNKTNDMIKIQLIDSNFMNSTQIIPAHDSSLFLTPEGRNIAQIINNDGKPIASCAIDAELAEKDPIGAANPYSLSPSPRLLNKFTLAIVRTRCGALELRRAEWLEYGKEVRLI